MKETQLKKIILDALQALAPEADLSALPPDVDLRRELDIDSFDYLNIMIALHEKLGVDIPESDYAKLTTLSGMLIYLSARLG
jgi:acyl carrier protein